MHLFAPAWFNQQPLQVPKAAAPTAVSLSRSNSGEGRGQGSVIHREIAQDRGGENESDEEAWNTVHVQEVGLWITGSRGGRRVGERGRGPLWTQWKQINIANGQHCTIHSIEIQVVLERYRRIQGIYTIETLIKNLIEP